MWRRGGGWCGWAELQCISFLSYQRSLLWSPVFTIYIPKSDHFMYRTVVTIRTNSLTFNNSTFCPHTVFMCFMWIWEQTAIVSLYSVNWLVFKTMIVFQFHDLQPHSLFDIKKKNQDLNIQSTATVYFSQTAACFGQFLYIWYLTNEAYLLCKSLLYF